MRGMLGSVAVLMALGLLLSSCSSDVVRLPDCVDCRSVEMTMEQILEVDLGWGIRSGQDSGEYAWVVADPGTMRLESTETFERSEGEDEFVGGVSHAVIMRLTPTEPGTTSVRFELHDQDGQLRQDLVEGQLDELEITIEVAG